MSLFCRDSVNLLFPFTQDSECHGAVSATVNCNGHWKSGSHWRNPSHDQLMHASKRFYFKGGSEILRVVYNVAKKPRIVVTAFFEYRKQKSR